MERNRWKTAHIDSPRIDLKASPIAEDPESQTLSFKTHYYGGIKKFHWLNIPLALHGTILKGDGKSVDIVIGEDPDDPIFIIGDLLVHLSRKVQGNKKLFEAFDGEALNIFAGHWPHEDKDSKSPIKRRLMEILNKKYGIVEEDLVTADIAAVPAGPARDIGFDQAMVGAYGQDDRICSITAVKAIARVKNPAKTAIVALYDKEEVGSGGNTGAQSTVLETFITDLLFKTTKGANYHLVTKAMENTRVLSGDVDAAVHPHYKSVHELNNAAKLGHGIVVSKFSGYGGKFAGNEASAEYYNDIRRLFNKHNIPWQNAELGRVDEGGGGTVAKYLANFNMEVIDCGPGVLSMHSPMEITSKADIYYTFRAYEVFLSQDKL